MKARKRNLTPTRIVIEQFFKPTGKPTGVDGKYESFDPNCLQCGAHVLPSYQIIHVEWHIKLTKLIEGKRDKL